MHIAWQDLHCMHEAWMDHAAYDMHIAWQDHAYACTPLTCCKYSTIRKPDRDSFYSAAAEHMCRC
jgi:hypothetical protein